MRNWGRWQGESGGDQVFAGFIESQDGEGPTVPNLMTPDDGVTLAPTRAYLSWTSSTDPDGGSISYNVYFGETTLPTTPQVTGITDTDFVIGPETQAMTGITLEPNKVYRWKIEAEATDMDKTSSTVRTLNTDNSVVGWWRFDEDPAGLDCLGGDAGETVCDYSGNNNHGIPFGGPVWIIPGMPDILGGALELDGVDDYVSVTNDSTLNPDSVTILSKIRTNGKTGSQMIIDKRRPGQAAYNLRVNGASFPLNIQWVITDSTGTETFVVVPSVISDGIDYHIVCTLDLTTGDTEIILEGISIHMENIGLLDRTNKSSLPFLIGESNLSSPPSASDYQGVIDEIIVINRPFEDDEALNNFNAAN